MATTCTDVQGVLANYINLTFLKNANISLMNHNYCSYYYGIKGVPHMFKLGSN